MVVLDGYLLLDLLLDWFDVNWLHFVNDNFWRVLNLSSLSIGDLRHSHDFSLDVQCVLVRTENNTSTIRNIESNLVRSVTALLLVGLEPSTVRILNSLVASEPILVRVEQDEMIRLPKRSYMIIFI